MVRSLSMKIANYTELYNKAIQDAETKAQETGGKPKRPEYWQALDKLAVRMCWGIVYFENNWYPVINGRILREYPYSHQQTALSNAIQLAKAHHTVSSEHTLITSL